MNLIIFYRLIETFLKTKSIQKLFNKTKAKAFVITKKVPKVFLSFLKMEKIDIPQIDVNVYDVTGAGDTFIGMLSYYFQIKLI